MKPLPIVLAASIAACAFATARIKSQTPPPVSSESQLIDVLIDNNLYSIACPPGCDCESVNNATGPCTSGKTFCVDQDQENCTGGHIVQDGWPTGCGEALTVARRARSVGAR
jgi:hypothetical protein